MDAVWDASLAVHIIVMYARTRIRSQSINCADNEKKLLSWSAFTSGKFPLVQPKNELLIIVVMTRNKN